MANSNTSTDQIAETEGWDTVFALHISDVNSAIARAQSYPTSFELSDAADGYTISGSFDTWKIVPGGSGDLILFAIPFHNCSIIEPGKEREDVKGTAKVVVRLNFIHEEADTTSNSNKQLLQIKSTPTKPGEKVASISTIVFEGKQPSFVGGAVLRGLLEEWLNNNLEDFDHVFATVNINRTASSGDFQWLQPNFVTYAYSDLGTKNDGALGVLCMTENRSRIDLAQQISSVIIPPGQRAGFLISKNRLIAKLLLPNMPKVFQGSKESDYKLSETGDSIVLASKKVRFKVKAKHGSSSKSYTAKVLDLQMTIEGAELQLSVTTETEISPGIRAYCQTQSFMGIRLVNKPDGTQTLGYFDSRPAVKNNWTKHDAGFKITEDILTVTGIVLALVAVVVTDGAAIGAASVIISLAAGLTAATEYTIEQTGKNDGPSIGEMVLNSTAAIKWSDSQQFKLNDAHLNGSLQLGGTLI